MVAVVHVQLKVVEKNLKKKKSFWKYLQEKHKNELMKKVFCKICKTAFMGYFRIKKLKEHILNPCSRKKVVCTQCGKKFVKSYHLKLHTNLHEREFDFECEDCNKKFVSGGHWLAIKYTITTGVLYFLVINVKLHEKAYIKNSCYNSYWGYIFQMQRRM